MVKLRAASAIALGVCYAAYWLRDPAGLAGSAANRGVALVTPKLSLFEVADL
jgi:hypothetical protein